MTESPARPPLELWGGIECTYNRVGDAYFDQCAWNGHRDRPADLDAIAELGIRTLRYPVIWEQIAPDGLDTADWRWADRALYRLYDLGVTPIVTLVHHGSGPRHTHLLDPGFAEGLAAFAEAVARRYPWLTHYTPVNEPLTTARFSALYGHWYPHARDNRRFIAALLNEVDATVLAMRAIRRVTPEATLIQTEDVGKTHSTPALAYQAEYENQRRWLSFDLLFGMVDRTHALRKHLIAEGVPERILDELVAEPCPPDIVGVNSYVTSERYLDDRLERYPTWVHGSNGRDAYADVEAVRAVEEVAGWDGILREAAGRYPAPIAVTETHLGGARAEQLRWLAEAWRTAQRLRADGIDIRALTVWALLGSHNWHRLVTEDVGHYEPGAFDIRGGTLRPTALAALTRALAAGRDFDHPALAGVGWWRRPDRLLYTGSPPIPAATDAPGPPLVVLAGDRGSATPLLTRMARHHLRGRFAPWRGEPMAELVRAGDWSATLLIPELDGRALVAVMDALDRGPSVAVTVIAGSVSTEPDVAGLLSAVAERALVVDVGQPISMHAMADATATLAPATLDDLLDLVLDRATGLWRATADGVLAPAPRRAATGTRSRRLARVDYGGNAEPALRPLDGSGRIR